MLESAEHLAETRLHAHHAIQLTFQLEGSFELCTEELRLTGPIAAVRADTPHLFRAEGAVALLFVEPESAAGVALQTRLFATGPLVALAGAKALSALAGFRDCLRRKAGEDELRSLGRKVVEELADAEQPMLPDPRVRKMIAYAQQNLDQPLSLVAAAAQANLSSSRARHVFVAHTGLPFKTYVLWLRIERAVQLYASGRSLTEAAHEAGFADSAHFSRTFRRTFGLPAAALRLHSGE